MPGFNVGEPAVLGSDLFVSSIGSVGCLDVRTGRFRWRHEGLYRDGMYNGFARPTVVDSRVVFPAVHADGGFPHEKWPEALEVDRQSGAIVGGFVPVTEKVVAREILRQKELNAIWSYDPVLIGDVTGDGAADFVFSGKAWSKFFVGVVAGPKPSKEGAWVLEFPVARDVQNAVPTQDMRLRLEKPSAFESADTCTTADQSTDCNVEATVRAAAGRGMKGIGVSDDQTDAFHVYWNPIGKRFQYWRR